MSATLEMLPIATIFMMVANVPLPTSVIASTVRRGDFTGCYHPSVL